MATKKTEKPEKATQETERPEALAAPEQIVTQDENVLLTLDELAQRHRVPTWQLGALLRFMNWETDRRATDDEFAEALRLLSGRPLGGGRL